MQTDRPNTLGLCQLSRSIDLRDALLDLLHLLREWWRTAAITVDLTESWIAEGSAANWEAVDNSIMFQGSAVESLLGHFGYPTTATYRYDEPPTCAQAAVSDALFVYAPEVEEELRAAIGLRIYALSSLRQELEARAEPALLGRAWRKLIGSTAAEIATFDTTDLRSSVE